MRSPASIAQSRSVRDAIRTAISENSYHFDAKRPRIPLSIPSFGEDEIMDALDSLVSGNVTMGEKVYEFEKRFSSYIGVKNATMVNSGSSANLLALSALTNPAVENHAMPNFEVVVPAVTWPTSIFPICNVQGVPVLTDVSKEDFNLNPTAAATAITRKTKALLPVHLLGNPVDMKAILELSKSHQLQVIEDCCEAHGAEISGRKVGSFGVLSTFSFYFSHHITTIEGGIVLTNNEEYAEVIRLFRAHGWIRESHRRETYVRKYPDIDPRFLFINTGYNLRPTEIQGAFGIHQLRKLDGFIEARLRNASYFKKNLSRYSSFIETQSVRMGTKHVWFGYPLSVRDGAPFTVKDLTRFLALKGIETRPIMGGNLAEQPALRLFKHRVAGRLTNSRYIMKRSFFFGIHHGLDDEARQYIVSCFDEFFKSRNLGSGS